MRAHKPISKIELASNMRPINVTLDALTWEWAKEKTNFSGWVRDQLRSERNKREEHEQGPRRCRSCLFNFCIPPKSYCNDCTKKMDGEEE
jgi:hypothetical protein